MQSQYLQDGPSRKESHNCRICKGAGIDRSVDVEEFWGSMSVRKSEGFCDCQAGRQAHDEYLDLESLDSSFQPETCEWCGGKGFYWFDQETGNIPCHECDMHEFGFYASKEVSA